MTLMSLLTVKSVVGAIVVGIAGHSVSATVENTYSVRRSDWRVGAVVYQVFVDRFGQPTNLEAKRHLYPKGRLHHWEDLPAKSEYDPNLKTYPHVIEFWGGDLPGLRRRLDYIRNLGADVLYTTPIFKAPSNHKYDTENYFEVDPQFGTTADLKGLISDVHSKGMKIMLDGVFNHIGVTAPIFQEALQNPKSPHRDWFYFGKDYALGYRGWIGISSLPSWHLETPGARNYLWRDKESVVQHYLREGIDGWRLDVGFELGPEFLTEITDVAHHTKPGSWVVGEVLGYPAGWAPALDGVHNFTMITLAEKMLEGKILGGEVGHMYEQLVADAGIENLLKSWICTDNHDTARLASNVPDFEKRKLIHALQLSLPGAPCLYYGTELGVPGIGDPEDRAPMPWKLAERGNPESAWVKKLLAIRKSHPALRYGDYRTLETHHLLAFARLTDKLAETAIVIVNPTEHPVEETFTIRVGHVMNWGTLIDQVTGEPGHSYSGMIDAKLKPYQVMILTPDVSKKEGYSPYNRIP